MEGLGSGERLIRTVVMVAGGVVALSGFLRWSYVDFIDTWFSGVELDFVPVVMFLGACSAGAAYLRWYLLAVVFALIGGFGVSFIAAMTQGGLFGTEPRPQDVGIGAQLALLGEFVIVVGGVAAFVFRLSNRRLSSGSAESPQETAHPSQGQAEPPPFPAREPETAPSPRGTRPPPPPPSKP